MNKIFLKKPYVQLSEEVKIEYRIYTYIEEDIEDRKYIEEKKSVYIQKIENSIKVRTR